MSVTDICADLSDMSVSDVSIRTTVSPCSTPTSAGPLQLSAPDSTSSDVISNRYKIVSTIGEGAQGKVKLAVDLVSGKEVALKFISNDNRVRGRRTLPEVEALRTIPQHSNVCHVLEDFTLDSQHVLVMEAFPRDLYSVMCEDVGIPLETAKRFVRQTLEVLAHCHQHGIAHRDIKPENILLDESDSTRANVKVCDFGLATRAQDATATLCGSEGYAAPEVVSGEEYAPDKVDVWSVGIVMYNIVTQFSPWSVAAYDDPVFHRFCEKRSDFWVWSLAHSGKELITPEFEDLFNGLCNPDPALRFTAAEALAHPFFQC